MVILSAIPKLDVFQIAEGLNERGMLSHLYTGFASGKKRMINRFVSRKDQEMIPLEMVSDLWLLPLFQRYHKSSIYNEAFDRLVASRISKRDDYKALLAWSGMAEHSLEAARKRNKFTVVGRGSCHISFQNDILTKEYARYGIAYKVDERITRKELAEYAAADKIYVCSSFVKRTFLDFGTPEDKIFVNPIAVPRLFRVPHEKEEHSKFTILFLGKLTIRKGLRYLFDALEKINIPAADYEAWFIGAADPVIRKEFEKRKKPNWRYMGFVPQGELPGIISRADLGIFPSLEDGFAQVVPQQLSCGIPVITTSHTGSSDLIRSGYNGFVVEPFNSDAIAEKIEMVFSDGQLLSSLKNNAYSLNLDALTPQAVANKFFDFFNENIGHGS